MHGCRSFEITRAKHGRACIARPSIQPLTSFRPPSVRFALGIRTQDGEISRVFHEGCHLVRPGRGFVDRVPFRETIIARSGREEYAYYVAPPHFTL